MNKVIDAALALIERWDTPLWKDAVHTAELIQALREAIREYDLVCLSETHQQLDEALEYELVGRIDGTYGGRWMLAAFAENASAIWPDGTAVYVRRVKE
jgi:hypothetical protein